MRTMDQGSWLHRAFHRRSSLAFKWIDGVSWAFTIASIVLLALELVLHPEGVWLTRAKEAEAFILAYFAAELSLRVISYRAPELDLFPGPLAQARFAVIGRLRFLLRPLNLIDLVTVLSFVPALRGLRAFRLLRLAHGVRLFRHSNPLLGLLRAFEESWLLYSSIFGFLLSAVVVSGLTLFFVEQGRNEAIETVADGFWWAMVTITTVGFGDITPVTMPGRWVGAALMVTGMFTLALAAGVVSTTLLSVVVNLREDQFRMSSHTHHLVVLGYDRGAAMLLGALLEEVVDAAQQIVLMGESERPPELPTEFYWVRGDPTRESELEKVRLSTADTVLVVASRGISPQQADAATILTVFTIKSYLRGHKLHRERKRPVYVVAEILDSENVAHARTAGADEVIETTRLGFAMMAHSVKAKGTGQIMSDVASAGAASIFIGRNPLTDVHDYKELSRRLMDDLGITVIGLEDADGVLRLGHEACRRVRQARGVVYLAVEPKLRALDEPA